MTKYHFQLEANAYETPEEFATEIRHDGQECVTVLPEEEAFNDSLVDVRFDDGAEISAFDFELFEIIDFDEDSL